MSWTPTADCNATFLDLFESGPKQLKFLPFSLSDNVDDASITERAIDENITSLVLNKSNMFAENRESFIIRNDHVMSDIQAIITNYDGVLILQGVKCQQYLMMRSEFYTSLIPIKDARDIVTSVKEQYFQNQVMIGIHYRAHDIQQDWEVVPPFGEDMKALPFGVGATLQDFQNIMTKIQQSFSIKKDKDSSSTSTSNKNVTEFSRFFIASNSAEAKLYFLSIFKNSITVNGDYNRSSKDGIFFALVEWLLLSESALILNTYGSSFAAEAAQVNMRLLVGIWGGRPVYHTDVRLPYCGHMLYMKEYSQDTVDTSYTEGTIDKRKVCNSIIKYKTHSFFLVVFYIIENHHSVALLPTNFVFVFFVLF